MVCLIWIHFNFLASIKMKFPEAETAAISSRIGKVLAGSVDWNGNRTRQKRKRDDLIKEKNLESDDDTMFVK